METGRVDGKVAGCDECNAWANLDTSCYLVVEFPAWGLTTNSDGTATTDKGDSGGLTYLIVSVPPPSLYAMAERRPCAACAPTDGGTVVTSGFVWDMATASSKAETAVDLKVCTAAAAQLGAQFGAEILGATP